MKLTESQREFAAQQLAGRMFMGDWRDLQPFTRAKCRTAILTMERIFEQAAGRSALQREGE